MGMRWGAWLAPCSILLVLACSETHGLGKKSPARDAGAHDAGATGPLAGSACEYLCGGIACDLRCDGDDLYRCQASGHWQLEQRCADHHQHCVLEVGRDGDGQYLCKDADSPWSGDDGGALDAGCAPNPDIGTAGCSYTTTPGSVKVTTIHAAPATSDNCAGEAVEVELEFTPDDPARAACFVPPTYLHFQPRLLVGNKNPPKSCIDHVKLQAGDSFPATRSDILSGTCTPVSLQVEAPTLLALCESVCM